MRKFDVQIALEGVAEARAKWIAAKREFDEGTNKVLGRLLHEAAACYMSVEEVAAHSGLSKLQVRSMMRQHGLDPAKGKTLLGKTAAEALASNAELMGINPHEMDLMSPLAYLPMGEQLRQALTDKTVQSVHEAPDESRVSGNFEDRIYHAIVSAFEGMGEAWTTDESGDTLAWVAARAALSDLGLCPTDGESMPCTTCGAGL